MVAGWRNLAITHNCLLNIHPLLSPFITILQFYLLVSRQPSSNLRVSKTLEKFPAGALEWAFDFLIRRNRWMACSCLPLHSTWSEDVMIRAAEVVLNPEEKAATVREKLTFSSDITELLNQRQQLLASKYPTVWEKYVCICLSQQQSDFSIICSQMHS